MINTLFPFLNRTIILYIMGTQYLGLTSLFSSILSILSLADLGFGTAVVFSLYKPIAEDDYTTICEIMQFYKMIYRRIGTIILILGVIVSFFVEAIVSGESPTEINMQLLFLIQLMNVVISYWLFAYKTSLLSAYQREDIISKISMVIIIIQYLLQFIVLYTTKNYYLYIMITPLLTLVGNVIKSVIVDKMYPFLNQQVERGLSEEIKEELVLKVRALFTHKIGGIIANSLDNIVISSFLGLTVIAVYNNYWYVYSSLVGFLTIFYTSIQAGLGNSVVIETREENFIKFRKLIYLNNWMVGWCTTCLLCLYQPFIEIWTGKDNMLPMSSVILFCLYFYINMSRRIVVTFKDAAGIWEADQFKPIVSGLANLVMNIVLVNRIGLNGVILSTIFAFLFVEIPWEMNIIFTRFFKENILEYIWIQLKHFVFWILMSIGVYYLCMQISLKGILELFVKGITCMVIPNIIVLILWKDKISFIKKYVKKQL